MIDLKELYMVQPKSKGSISKIDGIRRTEKEELDLITLLENGNVKPEVDDEGNEVERYYCS